MQKDKQCSIIGPQCVQTARQCTNKGRGQNNLSSGKKKERVEWASYIFTQIISVVPITRQLWIPVQYFSQVEFLSGVKKKGLMYFRNVKKVNSAYEPSAQANTGFYSMKQLGVFLLLSGWDASPLQGCRPSIKFTSTHLYTRVERGNVRVKCFAQGQNAMSQLSRASTQITGSETSTLKPWGQHISRHLGMCWTIFICKVVVFEGFKF